MKPGLIVGLTGGIGSGKSTAGAFFAQHGVPVLDTDMLAHELTRSPSPALSRIRDELGKEWLTADGSLDRVYARQQIFSKPETKARLEAILHPMIRARCSEWLSRQDTGYVLLLIPLLFEQASFQQLTNRSLLIDCPTALQLSRVRQRSGLTDSEIGRIIAQQMSREARLGRADDVICNDTTPENLQTQVNALHERYVLLGKSGHGFSNN
ncbi:dephospho-CoA kinase [Chitinilyticum litopenaei]|uniref:dephospho-CoA kinase n=1 Tax=Chitinilyticum litopenaei TaxID=1121276 RepID=UPI0003FE56C0|nr:dephospho-CoA kinase [Chitinilyticum litopenaei]